MANLDTRNWWLEMVFWRGWWFGPLLAFHCPNFPNSLDRERIEVPLLVNLKQCLIVCDNNNIHNSSWPPFLLKIFSFWLQQLYISMLWKTAHSYPWRAHIITHVVRYYMLGKILCVFLKKRKTLRYYIFWYIENKKFMPNKVFSLIFY